MDYLPEDTTMPEDSRNPYRATLELAPWRAQWIGKIVPRYHSRDLMLCIALVAAGIGCLTLVPVRSEAFIVMLMPAGALLGAGAFALHRRPLLGAILGCGLPLYLGLALWSGILLWALACQVGLR